MEYAFISYSTKNQSSADAMRDLFVGNGIKTWMAPGDIPAGSKYAKVINRAVKECACFILVLSEDAQNSVWVAKEVERAVNYRKPIIPVQIENVVLHDEFELYISTDQIIEVQKIDHDSDEIKKLLASVTSLTGFVESVKNSDEHSVRLPSLSKSIKLTIWSPVNTDVFLNDKKHLVMRIDQNSGFDYKSNGIVVSDDFDLIFTSHGFEKRIAFEIGSIDDRLDYRLQAILSRSEIVASYDRDEAINQISEEATAYAFKQLSYTGTVDDVQLLKAELLRLSTLKSKKPHINYLIATYAEALGLLASRYDCLNEVSIIADIYDTYEAKSSYGYMFDSIVNELSTVRLNDAKKSIDTMVHFKHETNQELEENTATSTQASEAASVNDEKHESPDIPDENEDTLDNPSSVSDSHDGIMTLEEAINDSPRGSGHLVASYRRVLDIDKDKCLNPIEISMPEGTIKVFDYCAEKKNEPDAEELYQQGCAYYNGSSLNGQKVVQDYAKAISLFTQAANLGSEKACVSLGNMYKLGRGTTPNLEEAVKWYQIAANKGNAKAQNHMGVCHYNGQGLPKNQTEAAKWFRLAADQGDMNSQYNLARAYDYGEGVPVNKVLAAQSYLKAAQQGHLKAQYAIGVCCDKGLGILEDKVSAAQWYQKAAQQGHVEAQLKAGVLLYNNAQSQREYADAVH